MQTMHLSSKLILPFASLALCGSALAQGDDCGTAAAITGSTTFDTTLLTESDYEITAGCELPVTNEFAADGFFMWMVPTTGVWDIDTIGTTWDTQLALYNGSGCTATCLDRDDDDGGFPQSRIVIPLTAGQVIMIQIGGFPSVSGPGASGPGNLNINPYTQDPACVGLPDDTFEDNDTCAAATPMVAGSYASLHVDGGDADFYSFTVPAGDLLTLTETADSNDTDYRLYDGCTSTILVPANLVGINYSNTTGASQTVVLEAHQWLGAALHCSDYAFDVTIGPDPCLSNPDDSFEDNDDCFSAAPIVDGSYPDLFVSAVDIDNYSMTVPAGGTLDVTAFQSSGNGDLDLFLWEVGDPNCGSAAFGTTELAAGYTGNNPETLTYTNLGVADQDVILEVSLFSGDCNTYDMDIMGAGTGTGPGNTFCDPANNNSSGLPTILSGTMTSPSGSGLHLESSQGPAGEFAYFLVGTGSTEPGLMLPSSAGRFCLLLGGGNAVGRYNVSGSQFNSLGLFDSGGVLQNLVSTSSVGSGFDVPTTLPISGSPQIMAGQTWHFQLWHREGGGSSNFSNGLSIDF